MSDNKVTLDQLDNSAVEAMSSSVGDVSMLNTENKTIVGAISEIVGKKEIANAIGEPLAETDKFTEMSSEINGLLSTFKTNMMNAGVVVESGDKFKALIDKIKGLTEGEGNKGVQFAEGTADNINLLGNSNTGWVEHKVNINVPFTPNRIILYVEKMVTSSSSGYYIKSFNVDSEYCFSVDSCFTLLMYGATYLYITDITNEGFSVYTKSNITTGKTNEFVFQNIRWYAIGVGEEDTTLRDSLADILENKGVDVTEEDDMASLITKVDDMTSNMIKYKSGIHEHTYDGNIRISFEVTGIGFKPTFVQVCLVNKSETDGGYQFWINNAYMHDSNSIYIPVESKRDLNGNSYTGLSGTYTRRDELVVNDDGFSLNITAGGISGHLWHFEWFVLG